MRWFGVTCLVNAYRNSRSQSTGPAAAPSVDTVSTMAVRLGHYIVLIPSPPAVNFEQPSTHFSARAGFSNAGSGLSARGSSAAQ